MGKDPKKLGETYLPPKGYLFCGEKADTTCTKEIIPNKPGEIGEGFNCKSATCKDAEACDCYGVRAEPGIPRLKIFADPGKVFNWVPIPGWKAFCVCLKKMPDGTDDAETLKPTVWDPPAGYRFRKDKPHSCDKPHLDDNNKWRCEDDGCTLVAVVEGTTQLIRLAPSQKGYSAKDIKADWAIFCVDLEKVP
jgi:hypothetical protein